LEDSWAYKQIDANFTFADLSLSEAMEKNRSLTRMEKINSIIDWNPIETLLLKHYDESFILGNKTASSEM